MRVRTRVGTDLPKMDGREARLMLSSRQARIRPFRVVPALPEPLRPLLEIARNLWWTWTPAAIGLFLRLDPDLWSRSGHNPMKLLGQVSQDRLERAAQDEGYLHELQQVYDGLKQHMERKGWFLSRHAEAHGAQIAYFCAEYGLTECFQIYSGGLGILAGDHLKSASELGVPLVGVGLLYQHGYFMQYLNADGWQQESYPDLDFAHQPIDRVRNEQGHWLKISVRMRGRDVHAGIWRAQVGRVPLYLLDTNQPENNEDDRKITGTLYGGDIETRIQQEILLGIGGVRALAAMGIEPTVFHINEGHAAFLSLERMRRYIEKHDVSFEEARQGTGAGNVFTTHTPVPAGIDRFDPGLVERYFRDYVHSLKTDMTGLLRLGRENPDDHNEFFSMAILAIRSSFHRNGVSRLHGEVSRRMWVNVWPGIPAEEVPIGHVTNGVHARSWLSNEMMTLFHRYLGYRWRHEPTDYDVWRRIEEIPDEELWAVHNLRRRKLVTWARNKIREQLEARGAAEDEIQAATTALDPEACTIGFARRFATYKRATLLLHDRERLARMLASETRPVQFLIAGKSHPADSAGKEFIRELVHFARSSAGGAGAHRVVFLENYDINVARYLVTGCDVWLNTPKRGLEASGTSGMKAALNGVINCSILDGWWDEAYDPSLGFAVGRREPWSSDEQNGRREPTDAVEAASLYDLLEQHILDEFYDRNSNGVPARWLARMKKTMRMLAPYFNTNRMVQEYAEQYYLRAHQRSIRLTDDGLREAKALAAQTLRWREHWGRVVIEHVEAESHLPLPVRHGLPIEAIVHLGELTPQEVSVEVYSGRVTANGDLTEGRAVAMDYEADLGNGRHRYRTLLVPDQSGRRGFAVRVLPKDDRLANPVVPGLITWERQDTPREPDRGEAPRGGQAQHGPDHAIART